MELGLREINELGWVVSLEGKQTVIASYWRVSNSHIKKSSRDVREPGSQLEFYQVQKSFVIRVA